MPEVTIYARQSMGSAQSIKEQLRLGYERARIEAWQVKGTYKDEVSASAYGRKKGMVRDDWARVRADLTDILWLWESSRGDRELSEWAAFLQQCRDTGTKIYVEQHERLFDMRKHGDWKQLADDGVGAQHESMKTSTRVQTGMDRNVREGRTHGRIPFGYTRRYEYEHVEGKRQRIVIQELHPEQAPVVKEIYLRIKAGESLKSIARDLNARGFRTNAGSTWTEYRVRSLALRILYAGKRIHNPEPSKLIGADTILTDGQWPAIITLDVFWTVYNKLTDPSRVTYKPGGAKHFLSLIAKCGVCCGPMTATARFDRGQWKYICGTSSHVMISKAALDTYVEFEIIRFLSDEANYPADEDQAGEIAELQGQIADKQAARERLAEAVAAGMDPAVAGKTDARMAREIYALEMQARELAVPRMLNDLIGRGDDIAVRWEAAPLSARREIARLVMDRKGYVTVHRAPKGVQLSKVQPVERVTWDAA